jgi:RHH-type proline utilization regulon transcriptional repressor/proline dehydrogenase/delta 1-pyrroline-5-carboxylate dehydrogenase
VGRDRALFVNAATWGLVIGRKLLSAPAEAGLSPELNRVIGKWGEPIIRRALEAAMQLLGRQFVAGESINDALQRAEPLEAKGLRRTAAGSMSIVGGNSE